MPIDLIQPFTQLGSTGVAMLLLWWIYKDTAARLDKKDEAFRILEERVRTEITTQLIASTSTVRDANKVMERIIDKLNERK